MSYGSGKTSETNVTSVLNKEIKGQVQNIVSVLPNIQKPQTSKTPEKTGLTNVTPLNKDINDGQVLKVVSVIPVTVTSKTEIKTMAPIIQGVTPTATIVSTAAAVAPPAAPDIIATNPAITSTSALTPGVSPEEATFIITGGR